MEIIQGIFSESFWYIAPMLVIVTTSLSGVINQWLNPKHGWVKQVVAWVVGSLASVAAWAIKLIEFGDPVWLGVVTLCAVVGLCSNGFYDIPAIRNFVNSWFNKELK